MSAYILTSCYTSKPGLGSTPILMKRSYLFGGSTDTLSETTIFKGYVPFYMFKAFVKLTVNLLWSSKSEMLKYFRSVAFP